MTPFLSFPERTISFAASKISAELQGVTTGVALTRRDHSLNEISNIAQDDTEALLATPLASFGVHRLDLHALQHWLLDNAAIRLEDAPATNLAMFVSYRNKHT